MGAIFSLCIFLFLNHCLVDLQHISDLWSHISLIGDTALISFLHLIHIEESRLEVGNLSVGDLLSISDDTEFRSVLDLSGFHFKPDNHLVFSGIKYRLYLRFSELYILVTSIDHTSYNRLYSIKYVVDNLLVDEFDLGVSKGCLGSYSDYDIVSDENRLARTGKYDIRVIYISDSRMDKCHASFLC